VNYSDIYVIYCGRQKLAYRGVESTKSKVWSLPVNVTC